MIGWLLLVNTKPLHGNNCNNYNGNTQISKKERKHSELHGKGIPPPSLTHHPIFPATSSNPPPIWLSTALFLPPLSSFTTTFPTSPSSPTLIHAVLPFPHVTVTSATSASHSTSFTPPLHSAAPSAASACRFILVTTATRRACSNRARRSALTNAVSERACEFVRCASGRNVGSVWRWIVKVPVLGDEDASGSERRR